MSGDVSRRNQSLFCLYHWDKGHKTEDCWTLKDHMSKLEKPRYLKEFIVWEDPRPQYVKGASTSRTSAPSQMLIGVIHAVKQSVKMGQATFQVMVVALILDSETDSPSPTRKVLFNPMMMC